MKKKSKFEINMAREMDRKGDIINAYYIYMDCVGDDNATIDDLIAASFIGFIFQDFGVASKVGVPEDLIDKAYMEIMPLLDRAEKRFGSTRELEFWRKYYALILYGMTENSNFCESYLKNISKFSSPINEKERYINQLIQASANVGL